MVCIPPIFGPGDISPLDKRIQALENTREAHLWESQLDQIPGLMVKEAAQLELLQAERARLIVLSKAALTQRRRLSHLRYWIFTPFLLIGVALGLTAMAVRFQYERAVVRSLRGECWLCGYDLRGGGDRCPECGTPR
jgi:hypothetical protein